LPFESGFGAWRSDARELPFGSGGPAGRASSRGSGRPPASASPTTRSRGERDARRANTATSTRKSNANPVITQMATPEPVAPEPALVAPVTPVARAWPPVDVAWPVPWSRTGPTGPRPSLTPTAFSAVHPYRTLGSTCEFSVNSFQEMMPSASGEDASAASIS
jgi:hypothetical protein